MHACEAGRCHASAGMLPPAYRLYILYREPVHRYIHMRAAAPQHVIQQGIQSPCRRSLPQVCLRGNASLLAQPALRPPGCTRHVRDTAYHTCLRVFAGVPQRPAWLPGRLLALEMGWPIWDPPPPWSATLVWPPACLGDGLGPRLVSLLELKGHRHSALEEVAAGLAVAVGGVAPGGREGAAAHHIAPQVTCEWEGGRGAQNGPSHPFLEQPVRHHTLQRAAGGADR